MDFIKKSAIEILLNEDNIQNSDEKKMKKM